jgi:signal transduction histidine kinase
VSATPAALAGLAPPRPALAPWRILVVDDDPEVHAVTRLALSDFAFEGRPLEILVATSAAEARALWRREDGIALVLLDVVMETDHAGLDFVRFVREEQGDCRVRLVLRTGQAGQAPALDVIQQYEIDDYRTKTDLTFQRLNVVVTTALRTYRLLHEMEQRRLALEESSREMERFAYVTTHDLHSPLRALRGLSNQLDLHHRDTFEAGAGELLDKLVRSARELEILIDNLLDYARVRRNDSAMERLDLNQVIEATRRRTQLLIEQRGALLQYGLLPQLEGDRALLEQLFAELIDNAIRFQPGLQPRVTIEAEDLGPAWDIRVGDRGPGIAAADHAVVFEPFRRLYQPGHFSGTGIGLAVCKRITEVHGGSIRICTAADGGQAPGTTIGVILPKRQHHRFGERDLQ